MLRNPDVQIVDVAVPASAQSAIIETALRAGKHVLAHKPLTPTLDGAVRLVDIAESFNRLLVVNQQMRWAPIIKAIDGRHHRRPAWTPGVV